MGQRVVDPKTMMHAPTLPRALTVYSGHSGHINLITSHLRKRELRRTVRTPLKNVYLDSVSTAAYKVTCQTYIGLPTSTLNVKV